MWSFFSKLLVFVAPLAVHDDAAKEQEKLAGVWQVEMYEYEGRQAAPAVVQEMKLTFTNDRLTLTKPRSGPDRVFTFKLDPTKTPKAIDTTAQDGPYKGEVARGIYDLDGDRLRICLPDDPVIRERPTTFETKAGSRLVLLVMKRTKG
jgi:uncharacterized protein (TIGR03067 family)